MSCPKNSSCSTHQKSLYAGEQGGAKKEKTMATGSQILTQSEHNP